MKYPFDEVMIRSTSRSQLREGDQTWEGRLGDSREPTNRNLIRGRQSEVSWHNTAKPFGLALEVNEAVVWRRFVLLPGESKHSGDGLPDILHRMQANLVGVASCFGRERLWQQCLG